MPKKAKTQRGRLFDCNFDVTGDGYEGAGAAARANPTLSLVAMLSAGSILALPLGGPVKAAAIRELRNGLSAIGGQRRAL